MNRVTGLIIMVALAIASCGTREADNRVVIAGKIDGQAEGTFRLTGDALLATAEPDHDGHFHLELTAGDFRYYILSRPGNALTLFLYPGDSIYITFDASDLHGTFEATGSRAAEADYLVEKSRITSEGGLSNLNQLMVKEAESFLDTKNAALLELEMLLAELPAAGDVTAEFMELETAGLEFFDLYLDYLYPMIHRSRNNIPGHESIDFPEEITRSRISSLDFNNPLVLKDRYAMQLLNFFIEENVMEILNNDPEAARIQNARIAITFDMADSLLTNPAVRDHVKFNALESNMGYRGPDRYRELYGRFLAESTTPAYNEKLTEIISAWEHISPGSEVPDFTFTDIESNQVRLSDLSGKLVYIDVWATWCGPCIAEHPHWNTLMEEYDGRDVAFLAISTDNTREPWEKMVTEKNMGGYNWYAENAWESEISQHFNIRAIPRFLLLDRERRVIDPSADRPSGNIREIFDQHL